MFEKFYEKIDKRVFYISGLICLIFVLFTATVLQRTEAAFPWMLLVLCAGLPPRSDTRKGEW